MTRRFHDRKENSIVLPFVLIFRVDPVILFGAMYCFHGEEENEFIFHNQEDLIIGREGVEIEVSSIACKQKSSHHTNKSYKT